MLLVLSACSFVFAQEPRLAGTWVYSDTTTSLTLKLNEDGAEGRTAERLQTVARGKRPQVARPLDQG
jgi:hypothetical protein